MRTWKGVSRKGSVNIVPKCIPSAVSPGPTLTACSPEAQEVHAHQDGQACQLPPAEREKPIMAMPPLSPILGKGGRTQVYWGLLKGGVRLGDQI